MSISADSQVQESNEEFNDDSPGVKKHPDALNIDLNNPPSNRTSAILRDDHVGYS